MLAIVQADIGDHHRKQNASKVLEILGQLDQQRINAKTKELKVASRRTTTYYFRTQLTMSENELTTLSNRLTPMKRFADPLRIPLVSN